MEEIMSRKFKKEVIDLMVEELSFDRSICEDDAIQSLDAFANHGYLSDNAYEEAPLEFHYCPGCKKISMDGSMHQGEHFISHLCSSPSNLILMRQVIE